MRAAVALQHGDAHLRHDLPQANITYYNII